MRTQPTISTHASFATGALVPPEGLDAAVAGVLDQLIARTGALRGVREATARTTAA